MRLWMDWGHAAAQNLACPLNKGGPLAIVAVECDDNGEKGTTVPKRLRLREVSGRWKSLCEASPATQMNKVWHDSK